METHRYPKTSLDLESLQHLLTAAGCSNAAEALSSVTLPEFRKAVKERMKYQMLEGLTKALENYLKNPDESAMRTVLAQLAEMAKQLAFAPVTSKHSQR